MHIQRAAPLAQWPDWAAAMLRATHLKSCQEVILLGIFMYANGVGRDVIAHWLRSRYKVLDSSPHQSDTSLPKSWLRRLQHFLDRVDRQDPSLWTWSIAIGEFVYLDGRPKVEYGQEGMLRIVTQWSTSNKVPGT